MDLCKHSGERFLFCFLFKTSGIKHTSGSFKGSTVNKTPCTHFAFDFHRVQVRLAQSRRLIIKTPIHFFWTPRWSQCGPLLTLCMCVCVDCVCLYPGKESVILDYSNLDSLSGSTNFRGKKIDVEGG